MKSTSGNVGIAITSLLIVIFACFDIMAIPLPTSKTKSSLFIVAGPKTCRRTRSSQKHSINRVILLESSSSRNSESSRRDVVLRTTASLVVGWVSSTMLTIITGSATASSTTAAAEALSPPKPRAPIQYLAPATAVRERVKSLVEIIATAPTKLNNNDKDNNTLVTADSSNTDAALQILNKLKMVLSPELIDPNTTRKAFDTYTKALQFSANNFSLNLPPKERKEFIRDKDSLLTVSNAIISDLDLRDLHRNEVVSLLQDISAEVNYQQKVCGAKTATSNSLECTIDLSELKMMIQNLEQECNVWFSFVPQEDVQLAYQDYILKQKP